MGLKNLKLATEQVKTKGGEFAVRGLSFVDISALVRDYSDEVRSFYDHYASSIIAGDMSNATIMNAGSSLLEMTPKLAGAVIAAASGDYDEEGITIACGLTVSTQIEALEKIGRLTFEAEGGPKKVLETVIALFQGTTKSVADLRVSKAGSLASVAK